MSRGRRGSRTRRLNGAAPAAEGAEDQNEVGTKQPAKRQTQGNKTGGKKGGQKQNGQKSGGQKQKGATKPKSAKPKKSTIDAATFWTGSADIPPAPDRISLADQPAAVVRSLGQPPLSGRETISEHYFEAVYSRAVGLASALAAAGGLLEDEPKS